MRQEILWNHQVADGCVCKGLDDCFILNSKPTVALKEVSEVTRKEIQNSLAWVWMHATA